MIDSAWNRLLQKIGDGNVVPIVGSRLLVGPDGSSSIQETIARKLLEDAEKPSDVALTPFRELNDAVFQLRGSFDGEELYDRVHDAIESVIHPKDPSRA